MSDKKCPKCGLWNSESAIKCDCGHLFHHNPDALQVKQALAAPRSKQIHLSKSSEQESANSSITENSKPESSVTPSQEKVESFSISLKKWKCPYCAEEIQLEAIICRFCGRSLTNQSSQVTTQKRIKLAQRLAELEKAIASWERYLQEQNQVAQRVGSIWSRVVWIFVGLLLTPVLIGVPILILAIIDILLRGAARSEAENNQSQARKNIEDIRKKIADICISQAHGRQW